MDFADQIRALAATAAKQADRLQTEEATKNALVMPLIQALGYNVFDPTEVVPEFIADVGTKKGEKVDYAVLRDGQPILLFECKARDVSLDTVHASQLFRYFSTTDARFAVLTNGIVYRFYSDLDKPNRMDSRPFLVIDLGELSDSSIAELKKFSKETSDLDGIVATAGELKYTREIKKLIAEEFASPSEEFARLFVSRVYDGRMTKGVRGQFIEITRRALHQFVNERIGDRLRSALDSEEDPETVGTAVPKVETTDQEIQAFFIVKAIAAAGVKPHRVTMRDAQSYCSVLLDNNNRKPICRLWFNSPQKYLGLLDAEKNEQRHSIETLDEIYGFSRSILEAVSRYSE